MSFHLLQSLKESLSSLLSDSMFRNPAVEDETEENGFIEPRIYLGALPPKRHHGQDNEDFPFIVIRTVSGEDGSERCALTTQIICGIYTAGDEAGGANDIQNLLDRIRLHLLETRIFAGRFELQLPLSWSLGGEENNQPHPYYGGQITANWQAPPQPRLETANQEVVSYGSGLLPD